MITIRLIYIIKNLEAAIFCVAVGVGVSFRNVFLNQKLST